LIPPGQGAQNSRLQDNKSLFASFSSEKEVLLYFNFSNRPARISGGTSPSAALSRVMRRRRS
jgi:hypothetical protein